MKKILLISSFLMLYMAGFAQESPEEKVSQVFGASNVEVVYCRPSVRGRVIFGDLVPYDKVWRTGANAATTIEFKTDVKFGGKPVKAGKYALFTIPGKTEWLIILNSAVKSWGAFKYSEKEDVARLTVKSNPQTPKEEKFTIRFGKASKEGTEMEILWDNVLVTMPIAL